MGTYALGCFLQDQEEKAPENERAAAVIRSFRNAGKLRALPVVRTNKETGALVGVDGTELIEYGQPGSGRWTRMGTRTEGDILYLGSASHAGHIELKALCVWVDGTWYNIISGLPQA